jgi:hypothetical protein
MWKAVGRLDRNSAKVQERKGKRASYFALLRFKDFGCAPPV